MATHDLVLAGYAWNLRYAEALVADLAPEQWTLSLGPGLENHAAWTLGHLVTGSDLMADEFGLARTCDETWIELFERRGPGDPRLPHADADIYPTGTTILDALQTQHARVAQRFAELVPAQLDAAVEWRFDGEFPTTHLLSLFMLVSHEAMHLGQLAAWRRAQGLPSALAAMPRGPSA